MRLDCVERLASASSAAAFTFLGFTRYSAKSKNGRFNVKRRTSRKKPGASLRAFSHRARRASWKAGGSSQLREGGTAEILRPVFRRKAAMSHCLCTYRQALAQCGSADVARRVPITIVVAIDDPTTTTGQACGQRAPMV
jgi:hypothetical protein